ncbi:hypothetical protein GCM10009661_19220 [Catellatospora chokoriensis]|uniref:Uncharacterized protein n=2 Tax=Catellatospora chokoriensis TaxID=310353 RepID=A0A8J3NU75_9ACTN|nr:hypothetical protein Cch02nite_59000 [Catellatospora chokoriensis]
MATRPVGCGPQAAATSHYRLPSRGTAPAHPGDGAMDNRTIASGRESRATIPHRSHRLAALCGAALAAAFFTPVPATAGTTEVRAATVADASTTRQAAAPAVVSAHSVPPELMARSLISTGMIGIGLALGGIVIVTHRRRQW